MSGSLPGGREKREETALPRPGSRARQSPCGALQQWGSTRGPSSARNKRHSMHPHAIFYLNETRHHHHHRHHCHLIVIFKVASELVHFEPCGQGYLLCSLQLHPRQQLQDTIQTHSVASFLHLYTYCHVTTTLASLKPTP